MSRVCQVTGKKPQTGHNVSHSNIKTKRRFLPNLRAQRLYSETLGESIRLRISNHALRTVEQRGGLVGYLLSTRDSELSSDLRRMKRRLAAARDERTAEEATPS